MQEPQFSYTIDELRALIGQKEVDLFVLRRELAKAEEVNAALYLELHPEPVAEGGSGGETP